jgi:hypothetical protein
MPQRIDSVLSQLLLDPSVGKAIPRIPGKTVWEIDGSRDISILGAQGGFIFIGPSIKTLNAIETLFLVHENLRLLGEMSDRTPGLFTQILGIRDKEVFGEMTNTIRLIRNKTAHPVTLRILEGDIDFELIPEKYLEFARILVAWNRYPPG